MNKAASLLFFSFMLTICLASTVLAAPVLTVSPSGQGNFVLQGSGFQNVGTIYATITYDASRLSRPRVTQGSLASGGLMAVNDRTPGVIIIGIASVSPFNGSGPVATISFTQSGKSGGTVSVTASFTDTEGKPLGQHAASGELGGAAAPSATSPELPTPAAGGVPTYLGDVSMPKDEAEAQKKEEAAPVKAEPRAAETGATPEAETPAAPAGEAAETKPAAVEAPARDVLERFRLFTGERTPASLIALFAPDGSGKVSQEPAIALSDGKTVVRMTVGVAATPKGSPNFVFYGATLKSLKKGDGNSWVIDALPKAGVYRAILTIVVDGKTTELPLTVTPPVETDLDRKGGVTESDFVLFLKERGTEKSPKFDLNRDGKRDYIDDYIFTANYVLKQKGKEKEKKGAAKKK